MWMEQVDTAEFLRVVSPALKRCGADELARQVSLRWTPQQLCQMLHHDHPDIRKLACVTLGLIGDQRCLKCVGRALRDPDVQVNQLAEHALWSIWFRTGNNESQRFFRKGMAALESDQPSAAVTYFRQAQRCDGQFASAFHQCAIAHYMLDEYLAAIECCRRAVELSPNHFGALATMGHCHAHMGNFPAAAECYRQALAVNPRMDGLASALGRIERATVHA
ncbi:MAG: tetratricopeptide repeat protein [Planctomycetes bacterium]|nr:tetratricopeptide repeat protein [Planctomycetota bacterium]